MAKTKKQRAKELYEMAAEGPSFSLTFSNARLTKKQEAAVLAELKDTYQIWVGSWVLPDLRRLLPDLKDIPLRPRELR